LSFQGADFLGYAGCRSLDPVRAGWAKRRDRLQVIMMLATFFQAGGSSGFSSFLIPLGLMFGIMYFMVIMPQQKQRKKVQEMLAAIKAGDRVITNGGIYGTINGIDGDSVILKIATDPQVKIRVARSAIAQVETPEDAK
jgi:preprotein translocase subunit YajC